VYTSPARSAAPGEPVRFAARLNHLRQPPVIDYGDGSQPETMHDKEITHAYQSPGLYTAAVRGVGDDGCPIEVKVCVMIDGWAAFPSTL
jgi:hypothetical protein